MDFSVNNKVEKKNNLNFQGLKGALSKKGNQIFQFVPPVFNKDTEKMILELAFLKKDAATGQFIKPKESSFLRQEFKENNFIELLQEKMQTAAAEGAFAYRYKIVNKNNENEVRYVIDEASKISTEDGGLMNVIDMGKSYGITPKGGAMRHSFLDSDGVLKNGELFEDRDFVRNHFNKLGGNIAGLNYLLTKTDTLEPYRYIISTPDIGVDPISSHKYWPCNQYQCSDINVFKEFNFNLFKEGKGYVADGAFTSQGIQSPMVHHILKWGENSPFYNMLKVNGKIKLGVLPDRGAANPSGAYGHLGVKIINSPKQEGYNANKPTYMQFFDDRLSSEAQRNENSLISAYDSRPKDHYEIVNHQDSVQPYYFELDPTEDADKIAKFGKNRAIMLDDIKDDLGEFLTFPHFSIDTKQNAAGATYWDGNRDIIKMNLSNPSYKEENKQGLKDAREYLYGVASFWSEAIQSELILKTAMKSDDEKKSIAKANDIAGDFIEDLFKKDNEIMPKTTFMVLQQNKTAKDYVQEFPVQSIETSPELSAIFAQPQFKKEFLSGKTEEQLTQMVEKVISDATPEAYKNNSEYKTYITKTYANAILKYVLAGAMNPDTVKSGEIDYKKLKDVTLKRLQTIQPSTVEAERKQVISKIKSGIKPELAKDISEKIKKEIKDISLEDFKRAEIIVEQGKGGLNWRFDAAKDIGDLDAIRANEARFEDIWEGNDTKGVVEFWSKFINNVHKYNPSSYIISEITDLWSFWGKENYPTKYFDEGLQKHLDSIARGSNSDAFKAPYVKEMQFLNHTNSTTSSNYNNYYNNLMNFIGINPESGIKNGEKGNLEALKDKVELLTDNAQPNTIILSHMFTDNHDKPRLLHAIVLDKYLDTYLKGTLNNINDTELLGKTKNGISAKAYAVGLTIRDAINKNNYEDSKREALIAQLSNLVLGKKDNSSPADYRRAEAFGTLPFEVTIRDMFKKAGYNDEQEIEEFTWDLVKNAAWKEERITQIMNAMTGVPTLYNGAEYAQTGYESSSKNKFVGNRGQIMHSSIKGSSAISKERKDFFNKINANMKMSQLPGLSALRDGFTMSLNISGGNAPKNYDLKGVNEGAFNYFVQQIKGKDTTELKKALNAPESFKKEAIKRELMKLGIDESNNNHANFEKIANAVFEEVANVNAPSSTKVWPIYKYDEKGSKVISVVSSLNLDGGLGTVENVQGIKLQTRQGFCPIEEGTKFARVIYKPETGAYVSDETVSYVVKNGNLVNEKDGQPVALNDTVTTFYAKNPSYNKPAFMGSLFNQPK